jgi:MoxR-like ATPase
MNQLDRLIELMALVCLVPLSIRGESYADYRGRMGIPAVFTGSPGVGKSSIIHQLGEYLEMKVYTFTVESADVEDFNGFVVKTPDGGLRRASDLEGVKEIVDAGEGILFLDETNTNPNRSLNAALNRLFLDGVWCRKPLPPGVRVLGAMNPPHLSAGGRSLPSSTVNRVCFLPFPEPEASTVADYLSSIPAKPSAAQGEVFRERLQANWEARRSEVDPALKMFWERNPSSLNRPPSPSEVAKGEPYPTPRSWHVLRNFLIAAECVGLSGKMRREVATGLVGTAVVVELFRFLDTLDIPSVEDVLAGKVALDTLNADTLYVVANSVESSYVRGNPPRKTWHRYMRYLERLHQAGYADLGAPLFRALTLRGCHVLSMEISPEEKDLVRDVSVMYESVLRAKVLA